MASEKHLNVKVIDSSTAHSGYVLCLIQMCRLRAAVSVARLVWSLSTKESTEGDWMKAGQSDSFTTSLDTW